MNKTDAVTSRTLAVSGLGITHATGAKTYAATWELSGNGRSWPGGSTTPTLAGERDPKRRPMAPLALPAQGSIMAWTSTDVLREAPVVRRGELSAPGEHVDHAKHRGKNYQRHK